MEMTTLKESVEISIPSETSTSAANEESTKETEINIRENSESETATPEEPISVPSNESTQETEINIKENKQNTIESVNLEASTSSANRHVVTVDISPEVSILETNESVVFTPSPQRRTRRSLRPISLSTINEDTVASISIDLQPSTSGLNNRLERSRDDNIYYDSSEDSSFNDSLDRHNQLFLIGVWNGPPEMNPLFILLVTLGVAFVALMGIYLHNIQPVYA